MSFAASVWNGTHRTQGCLEKHWKHHKIGREVMNGKVNLSFDEIPWDKINLSVPSQHWRLTDGLQVHFSELMQQIELCKCSLYYLTCCLWSAATLQSGLGGQGSSSEKFPLIAPSGDGTGLVMCRKQEPLTRVKLIYRSFAYTPALHCIH